LCSAPIRKTYSISYRYIFVPSILPASCRHWPLPAVLVLIPPVTNLSCSLCVTVFRQSFSPGACQLFLFTLPRLFAPCALFDVAQRGCFWSLFFTRTHRFSRLFHWPQCLPPWHNIRNFATHILRYSCLPLNPRRPPPLFLYSLSPPTIPRDSLPFVCNSVPV